MSWTPLARSANGRWGTGEVLAAENSMKLHPNWRCPESLAEYDAISDPEYHHAVDVLFSNQIERLLAEKAAARAPKPEWTRGENESDEDAACRHSFEIADRFRQNFPQFLQSPSNYAAISRRRQELGIAKYVDWSYDRLVDIYQALCMEGMVEVDPRAIGLPYDVCTGHFLKRLIREIPDGEKVLDPHVSRSEQEADDLRIKHMSSLEYDDWLAKKERAEAEAAGTAVFDEAELATFKAKRPDFLSGEKNDSILLEEAKKLGDVAALKSDALVELFDRLWATGRLGKVSANRFTVGVTRFQSGGNDSPNHPPALPDNAAIRKWINNHTADELETRLQWDSEFRAALDGMGA